MRQEGVESGVHKVENSVEIHDGYNQPLTCKG